jgi:hypothetical protein
MQRALRCLTVLLYTSVAVGGIWLCVHFLLPWGAPFLLAMGLAALLEAPVRALVKRGWKRRYASALLSVASLSAVLLLLVRLLSRGLSAVAELARQTPVLVQEMARAVNRLEAGLLSGVKIRNESDLAEAANALLSRGLSQVHISLGGRGVYAADQREQLRLPIFPVDARNMTGAGDAYLAGLVYSHLNGYPLRDAARFASAAAAVAVQGEGTVNEAMSPEAVLQVMGGSLRSQSGE